MTSPRTTYAALAASIVAIVYFVLDRWLGVQIPPDVEGAIGVIVFALVGAIGAFARDNRVSSEDVGIKESVTATIGAGSTMTLAQPVEVVEPEPWTTPEAAAPTKDASQ